MMHITTHTAHANDAYKTYCADCTMDRGVCHSELKVVQGSFYNVPIVKELYYTKAPELKSGSGGLPKRGPENLRKNA